MDDLKSLVEAILPFSASTTSYLLHRTATVQLPANIQVPGLSLTWIWCVASIILMPFWKLRRVTGTKHGIRSTVGGFTSKNFVQVHAHIHETLSTILLGLDKNWEFKNKRNLLLCHNRLNITQREWFGHEILFLQLCRYIRMIYSLHGATSELGSTRDKTGDMDYTRVTKSKGRVDSRVLGSSAMH